jgi:hypothetical protein
MWNLFRITPTDDVTTSLNGADRRGVDPVLAAITAESGGLWLVSMVRNQPYRSTPAADASPSVGRE